METGVGDRLARGAVSAIFQASDGNVTDKQWQAAFEGWSLEEFMKGEKPAESGRKETNRRVGTH